MAPVTAKAWDSLRYRWNHAHGLTNVWSRPPLHDSERLKGTMRRAAPRVYKPTAASATHLNQKPLEFMERIIYAVTQPGDVVWEPFGGLAAAAAGSRWCRPGTGRCRVPVTAGWRWARPMPADWTRTAPAAWGWGLPPPSASANGWDAASERGWASGWGWPGSRRLATGWGRGGRGGWPRGRGWWPREPRSWPAGPGRPTAGAPGCTGRARRGTARPAPGSRCAAGRSRAGSGRAAGVDLGRHDDALRAEGRRHPGAKLSADVELHAGQRPRHHAHRELVDLHPLHAHHGRRVEHHPAQLFVGVGLPADAPQHIGGVADVDRDRDWHVDDGPRPVAGQVGDLDDLAVRRGDDLAVDRPDAGDSERDLLDRPDGRLGHPGDGDADHVAEAVLPLAGDEEPGADVLDEPLQAEAERGADQRRRGHQAAQRHAEALDDQHGDDDVDDRQQAPGDDLRQHVAVLGGLGADKFVGVGRPGVDARHDPAARPVRQPGEQDRPEDQQDDLQQVPARPAAEVRQRRDCAGQRGPPV